MRDGGWIQTLIHDWSRGQRIGLTCVIAGLFVVVIIPILILVSSGRGMELGSLRIPAAETPAEKACNKASQITLSELQAIDTQISALRLQDVDLGKQNSALWLQCLSDKGVDCGTGNPMGWSREDNHRYANAINALSAKSAAISRQIRVLEVRKSAERQRLEQICGFSVDPKRS